MAEQIDSPLIGLWTQVVRMKHKFSRIRQVTPLCAHGRAHLRHLGNTIEPSVWNKLAEDVVTCTSVNSLKTRLDLFMHKKGFI